jgi:Protease inhibitor Inh
MDRSRRLRRASVATAALALTGAAPPTPADMTALAGAWDLVLDGSHRKCRVTLALDPAGVGHALRFPAGCRKALPVLKDAGGWLMQERGALRLVDAMGEPALELQPNGQDRFIARTAKGETYRLEREEEARLASLPPPAPPIGVPQATPIDPEKAPPLSSLPGTYVVDGYTEREVCQIGLTQLTLSASGRYEARLLEGCRDQGLRTFDPLTWHYEGGRLTLTSRRGHHVTLVSERPGQWRRDPEVGATLILRKMAAP